MTYLHDYVTAREKIREVSPKLIAGLMPILDRLGFEYHALREGQPAFIESADSLLIKMPDGVMPNGYILRIDFVAANQAPWKTASGEPAKGPGF